MKDLMQNLVQRQLEAYNRKDLIEFCNCYHDDVKVSDLVSGRLTCEGKKQFKELYRNLFEANPNLRCEIKNRIILDNAVIDEELVSGILKYPNGLHIAAIYGFRDNLIDRVWFPR